MLSLQEQEGPIEQRIETTLIEATPESWRIARLDIEVKEENGMISMPHIISSPEGLRDIVSATDEILDATFELLELFRNHGKPWRQLSFEVTEEDGNWRYVAHFDY